MAGGRAQRFGQDKLVVPFGDDSLLAHVVRRMSPWFSEVIVVHAPGREPDLGTLRAVLPSKAHPLAAVPDERPDGGPLVGLASGLAACHTDWAFMVGGDMPFIVRPLVELLWREAGAGGTGEASDRSSDEAASCDVAIVRGQRGLEPLCAFYRRSVLPHARAAIEAGERRVISFFGAVRVLEVAEATAREFDPSLASFFNINTHEDLLAAEALRCASAVQASPTAQDVSNAEAPRERDPRSAGDTAHGPQSHKESNE